MGDTSETIIGGKVFLRDSPGSGMEIEQRMQGNPVRAVLTVEEVKQLHWFVHAWLSANGVKTTRVTESEG